MPTCTSLSPQFSIGLLIHPLLLLILLLAGPVYAINFDIEGKDYDENTGIYGYRGVIRFNNRNGEDINRILIEGTKAASIKMVNKVKEGGYSDDDCPRCIAGVWAEDSPNEIYFHSSVKGLGRMTGFFEYFEGTPQVSTVIKNALDRCKNEFNGLDHIFHANCAEPMVLNHWLIESRRTNLPTVPMKIITIDKDGNPMKACSRAYEWGCKEFLQKLGIEEVQCNAQNQKREVQVLEEGRIVPRAPPAKQKKSKGKSASVRGGGSPVLTLTVGGSQSCPMPKKPAGKTPKNRMGKTPKKSASKTGNCPKGQKAIMNKDPKIRKGQAAPACAPPKKGSQPAGKQKSKANAAKSKKKTNGNRKGAQSGKNMNSNVNGSKSKKKTNGSRKGTQSSKRKQPPAKRSAKGERA